ncbi:MAG TPA: sugar ABC transporter ATP-binding protein [Clostridiaceae bacterium]|nr:sugar ABC transporter ATP-binding protein [Clostridiaceae bacterium]
MQKELIRLEGITKLFPGVRALNDVSFDVRSGEVHALIGENGAGKSTLIKIMMGVYEQSEGKIFIENKEVNYRTPAEALKLGLGAVYQDVTLANHLTVGENFFLGNLPRKMGMVDWNEIYSASQSTLDDLNINIDSQEIVGHLTIGQQEMVSIAKIIYQKANVLVFDEPTALLTNEEVEILFDLINRLRDRGYGIIYISHRLEEIFQMCDRVTVLKNGEYVDTLNVDETDENELVQLMVGRSVEDMYGIQHVENEEVALRVENLTGNGFQDISFEVHKGEIFGMFGLIGAGRTEICRAIFGADKYESGQVYIHGKPVHNKKPIEGIASSIAFLTEDRKKEGLCLGLDVEKNINLASYPLISKNGFINLKTERERAEKYIDEIRIKTPSRLQLCQNLSGGNQQKVVIGKWMCCDSDIFIFDEPTVGVDIGAKAEIYKLIEELIADGKAVILISSYLPEVMGLSDRLFIMSEGKCTGLVDRKDFYDEHGKLREDMALSRASGIMTD